VKIKNPRVGTKLPLKINIEIKKVTYEDSETYPPITIVSVPTEMEP